MLRSTSTKRVSILHLGSSADEKGIDCLAVLFNLFFWLLGTKVSRIETVTSASQVSCSSLLPIHDVLSLSQWCRGVVIKRVDPNTSSNRARVTMKTPSVRKATGNHLMNSTSLEKTQSPVSGWCYAQNRVWDADIFHCLFTSINYFDQPFPHIKLSYLSGKE